MHATVDDSPDPAGAGICQWNIANGTDSCRYFEIQRAAVTLSPLTPSGKLSCRFRESVQVSDGSCSLSLYDFFGPAPTPAAQGRTFRFPCQHGYSPFHRSGDGSSDFSGSDGGQIWRFSIIDIWQHVFPTPSPNGCSCRFPNAKNIHRRSKSRCAL